MHTGDRNLLEGCSLPRAGLIWILGMPLLAACVQVDDGRGHPSLLVITVNQPDAGPESVMTDEGGMLFSSVWHPNGSAASILGSLLTGLHPEHHGINALEDDVGSKVTTLASRIYEQDVWTGAVVAIGPAQPAPGLKKGFERFSAVDLGAMSQVVQTAKQWMTERSKRNGGWMVWAHLGTTHSPSPGAPSPVQALMAHAEELDPLARTLVVVINLATSPRDAVSQSWCKAFLPRARSGESAEVMSFADFSSLFIEHLSEPTWPLAASQPTGLDGISPGLALFGLPARRGPVVFDLPGNRGTKNAIALFEGWSLTTNGTIQSIGSTDAAPSMRVKSVLSKAIDSE